MIVGVQATAARMSQETVAAQNMLTRFAEWQGRAPESVAADTTMGTGSSYSGWLTAASLPTCGRETASTERGVRSSGPSVSLRNRNTIAISVPPASPSTTGVERIGIAPSTTLEPANVVVRVR